MKIAIAGYGLEGKANYAYWTRHYPEAVITIADERPAESIELPDGVASITGEGAFSRLQGFDMVIRTAGLAPHKITTDGSIWSGTNEFFANCPAPIIGVTGTKGKGTTSSMIAAILRADGRVVHLVGNIGVPAIELLDTISPDDIVVFELSSFQLWDIQRSPKVSVVLGIEPDHLNVHVDMEDYVAAKGGIRRFQQDGDVCIYHPTNHYARDIAALTDKGVTKRYAVADEGGVYASDGYFRVGDRTICPTDIMQVPGLHNIENACAAMTAARELGVGDDVLAKGIGSFEGLPHRIEFVREHEGVLYYNDSFSSAPAATVAAIRAFQQPEIVVIGGIDKGADFSELASCLRDRTNIKEIVLIGEVRHALRDFFAAHQVPHTVTVSDAKTMTAVVEDARRQATAGDIVLLSPGCASFDMFRDFYDRGDQFREVVNAL
ncbi:UDP-N-acetylmuramoyl-L-alanine--D-glutamate ligase [Candidatus Saccharibacteria bacterium]|nr:UDP-N-acetylmuramoyl-L-alanine--D-glutamate ligase [Candidatus Saccharibacteria bacterium]